MASRPPSDPEAEREILSTVMVWPESIERVIAKVGEDDFHRPQHRWLFVAMVHLAAKGDPILPMTLDLQLEIDGHGRHPQFIEEVYSGRWHSLVALDALLDRVRAIGEARRLMLKVQEISESMKELYQDPTAWVENAKRVIEETAEAKRETKAKTAAELVNEYIASWKAKKEGAAMGMSYGLGTLDHRLLGIIAPEYVIIAARPSVGKSVLALQIASNLSVQQWRGQNVCVRYDNFESTSARLTERLYSQVSRIDYMRARTANFNAGDNEMHGPTIMKIRGMRLDVEDQECDENTLAAKWKSWRHDIGIDNAAVIVLDYLQLVDPSQPKAPRELQVTMVSRACRKMSKRLNCGVIACCQLNRDVDKRGSKAKPQLSDLRESGSIEQDASTVIAIHRPGAIAEADEERRANGDTSPREDPRYTELIVLKARDGEVGIDKLSFNGRVMTFEEIDRRPEPDAPQSSSPPRGQLSFNPKHQPD